MNRVVELYWKIHGNKRLRFWMDLLFLISISALGVTLVIQAVREDWNVFRLCMFVVFAISELLVKYLPGQEDNG